MYNFKIGGKITVEDGKIYRIVEILELNGMEYLFCCTIEKPITPKVLEVKREDGKVFVKIEEDPELLRKIALKVLK